MSRRTNPSPKPPNVPKEMSRNKLASLAKAQRQAEVAKRYLEHTPQFQIALDLGVSDATISTDLKEIMVQWVNQGVRDFDMARAEELGRINYLEAVYWEEFRNSKRPKVSSSTKERTGGGAPPPPPGPQVVLTPNGQIVNQRSNPGTVMLETGVTETTRDGDPRYLEGIRWCIETRIKLLGLNAPQKSTLDVNIIKAYSNIDLDNV